ncbi:MAG: ATP-binding cassette domain-containing protein [Proteobacteria bacterium]|nr:ATP-binding cassette domain-containing protein [Pseudomonadota bacterium]
MLELKNIFVTIGKDSALEQHVLKDLNLRISKGEFVVIIGGNGAGKSTLFNTISGEVLPTKGSIFLKNININRWPNYKRSSLISQVPQDPRIATMDAMTLEENLSFAYMRGQKRTLLPQKTSQRLNFFHQKLSSLNINLENRLHEMASNLSGGERQILSLIMATLHPSEILLLDEITAALDPKMADLVMNLTQKIVHDSEQTTLMITHNMDHALKFGDRTLLLKNGKIEHEFSRKEKQSLTPADLSKLFNVL